MSNLTVFCEFSDIPNYILTQEQFIVNQTRTKIATEQTTTMQSDEHLHILFLFFYRGQKEWAVVTVCDRGQMSNEEKRLCDGTLRRTFDQVYRGRVHSRSPSELNHRFLTWRDVTEFYRWQESQNILLGFSKNLGIINHQCCKDIS